MHVTLTATANTTTNY